MIRNPHTLEDSWWDGPERFQWVNRNVVSQVQGEDLNKFMKIFAPKKRGLDIGGTISSIGERSTWINEKEPLTLKLNLIEKKADIPGRAEALPFQDETFGYIVSFHTFEHIKGGLRKTLKEWLRILVSGGLIGIVMPDRKYFLHNPEIAEEGEVVHHEMNPEEFLTLFYGLNVEILLFNTRQNNFDMEIVVRKKGHI